MTSTQTRDEIIRDTKLVRRFVQTTARYKSGHWETYKWEAYSALGRIARGMGLEDPRNFGAMVAVLDFFGVTFKQQRRLADYQIQEYESFMGALHGCKRVAYPTGA